MYKFVYCFKLKKIFSSLIYIPYFCSCDFIIFKKICKEILFKLHKKHIIFINENSSNMLFKKKYLLDKIKNIINNFKKF